MVRRDQSRKIRLARESIAMERVKRLLELADEEFSKRPYLSHRYAKLAWMLKTRYRLRFPPSLNRKICRKCQSFLVPGSTCRVRARSKRPPHVAITCLKCGHLKRVPYKGRKNTVSRVKKKH